MEFEKKLKELDDLILGTIYKYNDVEKHISIDKLADVLDEKATKSNINYRLKIFKDFGIVKQSWNEVDGHVQLNLFITDEAKDFAKLSLRRL